VARILSCHAGHFIRVFPESLRGDSAFRSGAMR
jgi:hypothetical protein